MNKLLLASAITLTASTAFAQDYQVEAGLGYISSEISGEGYSWDTSATTLYGAVYFDKVDTSKGPLAEAAFLDKASGIVINHSIPGKNEGESESAAAIRYVASEKWIIESNYSSAGDDGIGFGFGTYLSDNIDLVGHFNSGNGYDIIGANMHGIFPISGDAALAFDLDVSNLSPDEGDSMSIIYLSGTYYFTKAFGISAKYITNSGDSDSDSFIAGANWFIQENIDLSLSYNMTSYDYGDIDTAYLNASVRF